MTFRTRPGKVGDDEYADKEGTEENGNIECLENVIIIDSDSGRRRLCRITSRSEVNLQKKRLFSVTHVLNNSPDFTMTSVASYWVDLSIYCVAPFMSI